MGDGLPVSAVTCFPVEHITDSSSHILNLAQQKDIIDNFRELIKNYFRISPLSLVSNERVSG